MKALVLEAYNKFVYREVPAPVAGPGEVLIRIKACGICGSDIHGMDGSTGRRIPPLIMGHEASGIIEDTGPGVNEWHKGNRVTFDSTVFPLNDWFTLEGQYNLSESREVLGVSPGTYRRNGAFAEYIVVPEHILFRIPENVTFEQAALVEPVAVALHAVNLAGIKPGSSCLVAGVGMIGSFIIQILRMTGVPQIIALDINVRNLESAKKKGATLTFDANADHIPEHIFLSVKHGGVDVSFEAAGMEKSVNLAIDCTRSGGTVVLVGNSSKTVSFPVQKVVTKQLTIQGSCAIRGEYETVLDFISRGMISVNDTITAVAPLKDGAEWFSRLKNNQAGPGKVILVP